MSVEFIGYVSHQESSEIHLPEGPAVNPPWIAAVAQAHEYGGFDRVLIAQNEGAKRLLAEAAKGNVVDTRLWTGITALTRAAGNSTALVGTPQQVADALLEYSKLGVSTFLIRGFDPLEDALAYGRDLLPLVRAAVAKEDDARHAAAA